MKIFSTTILFLLLSLASVAQTDGDTLFKAFYLQSTTAGVTITFTVKGGIQCTGVSIERSGDGTNFTQLYEYPGVCGSPGSDETYGYLDANPLPNHINYYRLSIGGFGLKSSVKSVLHIVVDTDELLVIPNPCSECTVRFPNEKKEKCEVRLTDINGRIISSIESRDSEFTISVGTGALVISVIYPNQEIRQSVLIRR